MTTYYWYVDHSEDRPKWIITDDPTKKNIQAWDGMTTNLDHVRDMIKNLSTSRLYDLEVNLETE